MSPPSDTRRPPLVALALAWLVAGAVAGTRLHLRGGVFGEGVPLGASIQARLVEGIPWVVAAVVAWWSAGRWPLRRHAVLRPLTLHAGIGLAVVIGQQILLAALRATLIPPGLRPLAPWRALPAEWTGRAPVALAVYGTLVLAALAWRRADDDPGRPHEVPGAGRGDGAPS